MVKSAENLDRSLERLEWLEIVPETTAGAFSILILPGERTLANSSAFNSSTSRVLLAVSPPCGSKSRNTLDPAVADWTIRRRARHDQADMRADHSSGLYTKSVRP